ncbi:MAG: MmgE/PrpD family protein [candidate division NC10 bacterium]|nr:MmgE/PrpD family protein [candidate division NC10 bacterium]
MMSISLGVAGWAANLDFASIPSDIADATKLRILDVVGVCVSGRRSAVGAAIEKVARTYVTASETRAFAPAGATRFPLFNAFANGTLAAALDYDDTHNSTVIHPSSPAICAVLALAGDRPATGRELIASVAAGVEACCRIGMAAPGEFHRRGLHPTGVLGVFASTIAAARFLGLDPVRTQHAIGIAASFGAGIMQAWLDGSDVRFCHTGFAASSGVLAAQLAAAGVTGPTESLEGKFGIFRTHLQGEAAVDPSVICDGIGQRWESRNVSFKPYPTAHVTHSFIDAALHLRRLEAFQSDEIVGIVCPVAEYMVALVCEPAEERRNPRTVGSARISLPHIIAEALVFGEIGPRSFSEERRSDPRVRALAERTAYQIDPDAPGRERYKGWVQIRLRDGRVLERVEEHNLGSPQKPLGEAALREKFLVNVEGVIGAVEAERMADLVLSLDRQDDTLSIITFLSALNPTRREGEEIQDA